MLFRRQPPPDDERQVKAVRLDALEDEVRHELGSARRSLADRDRLASAVDDAAQSLRPRRRGAHR